MMYNSVAHILNDDCTVLVTLLCRIRLHGSPGNDYSVEFEFFLLVKVSPRTDIRVPDMADLHEKQVNNNT